MKLYLVIVRDTKGCLLVRRFWATNDTPKQIREQLVGEEYGTYDKYEVKISVRRTR